MEIGILRRILKRAKRWHFVEDEIPRLPERRDIGRALKPEEKFRLLKVAKSNPDWETAYLAAVLALNTTMRGCELKQMTWRDVDLIDRSLVIRRSKTRAGERVIPLNAETHSERSCDFENGPKCSLGSNCNLTGLYSLAQRDIRSPIPAGR